MRARAAIAVRRGGPAAFTLIEVLLAMAIFLLGVTSLLGLFQFGGGMQSGARAHAALAPAIQPLVEDLVASAWRLDASGAYAGLREVRGEPVPGAPDYRYDLRVETDGAQPQLGRAEVRFYRRDPDRPVARVAFLLPRQAPLRRWLEVGG